MTANIKVDLLAPEYAMVWYQPLANADKLVPPVIAGDKFSVFVDGEPHTNFALDGQYLTVLDIMTPEEQDAGVNKTVTLVYEIDAPNE